jgi:mannosyl-oligosaccharide alpha-1,2-mannosidase
MLLDNPNKFGWRKQLRTFSLSIRTLCSQRFQLQFCLCFCLMIVVIVIAVAKTLSYTEAFALSLEDRAATMGSRFVSKTATSFTSKLRNTTQIFSPFFSMMQNHNVSQSSTQSTVSPKVVSAATITAAPTAVKVEVPYHDGFRITLPADALQAAEHAAEEGGESASDLADAYAELKTPAQRLAAIRQEVEHAWNGYESYAFGHDEIRPVSNITNDSWGGFGATLIDALDTLILLGLDEQVARARAHVEKINFDKKVDMSFFETTIRYLGGLLGAYELSRDELYLTQAKSLGDRLVKSFDGTPSGLPQSVINLHTLESHNLQWTGRASILAEVGSCQLEFGQLSRLLKDPSYYDRSKKVYERLTHMSQMHDLKGLYPSYLNIQQSKPHPMRSRISLGGLSDSFYEYLLKVYLFDPSYALPLQVLLS